MLILSQRSIVLRKESSRKTKYYITKLAYEQVQSNNLIHAHRRFFCGYSSINIAELHWATLFAACYMCGTKACYKEKTFVALFGMVYGTMPHSSCYDMRHFLFLFSMSQCHDPLSKVVDAKYLVSIYINCNNFLHLFIFLPQVPKYFDSIKQNINKMGHESNRSIVLEKRYHIVFLRSELPNV